MTDSGLQNMTVEDLVKHFAANGIAQSDALLYDEISKLNRLVRQMRSITEELKTRGTDAQLALLKLYNHPNVQVRLQAARKTLEVAPIAARSQIEAIAASKDFPQAGDAGMTISGLDGKFG
jgi:hypothetical protein